MQYFCNFRARLASLSVFSKHRKRSPAAKAQEKESLKIHGRKRHNFSTNAEESRIKLRFSLALFALNHVPLTYLRLSGQ
jgi:hypothetical protein